MRAFSAVFLLFIPVFGIIDVYEQKDPKDRTILADPSVEDQAVREEVPGQYQYQKNDQFNVSDIPDVDQQDQDLNKAAELWEKLKQEQEAQYNEFREKLREKEQKKLQEKEEEKEFNKFKDFWNKLGQDREEKFNDFKQQVQEKKEERRAQKEKEHQRRMDGWQELKEKAAERLENFKNKINEKKKQIESGIHPEVRSLIPKGLAPEQKKQLVEELLAVFEGIANATKVKKTEEKAIKDAVRQQLQPQIHEFFKNMREKINAWRTAKEEDKAQRWEELKVVLSSIIENIEQKKQEKIGAIREFWNSVHDKITPILDDGTTGVTVQPALKGSVLDQITGTSAWQNVTWILLAVCVFLALALLILVFYQTTQSKKFAYQKLPGDDFVASTLHPRREMQQAF